MIRELLLTLPVERLGHVLVHFVWQGALVAALLAVLLCVLRRHAASVRYAACLAALFVMAALPVATWLVLTPPAAPFAELAVTALPPLGADGWARVAAPPASSEPSLWMQAQTGFDAARPWLVAGWLLGVAVLSVRLAGGWAAAQRLRWRGTHLVGPAWTRRFEKLARRLRVPEAVRLVVSTAVEGPMTLGWWRPVVLVPAGVLTGLPPEQVEAILAHELAHIRRYDYLVGLAQSAVETLLFYHPAVWWVSRQVRVLREHCCDDLAAAACADRLTYARALTALEGWRPGPRPALSAAGVSLGERVRRLVGASSPSEGRRPVVLLALLFVALCAAGGQRLAAETFERPEQTNDAERRALQRPLRSLLSVPADTTDPDTAGVRVFLRADSLGRAPSVLSAPDAHFIGADSPSFRVDSLSGAWAFSRAPDLDSLITFSLRRVDSALQHIDWPSLQERTLQAKLLADSALANIDWPGVQAEIQQGQNQTMRFLQRLQQRRDTLGFDSLLQRYHGNVLKKLLRQEDHAEVQEEARAEARRVQEEARQAQEEALQRTVERLYERAEQLDEQGHAEAARALREESRRLSEQRSGEPGRTEEQALRERQAALEREILDLKRQSRALEREAGRLERERDALREERRNE